MCVCVCVRAHWETLHLRLSPCDYCFLQLPQSLLCYLFSVLLLPYSLLKRISSMWLCHRIPSFSIFLSSVKIQIGIAVFPAANILIFLQIFSTGHLIIPLTTCLYKLGELMRILKILSTHLLTLPHFCGGGLELQRAILNILFPCPQILEIYGVKVQNFHFVLTSQHWAN